MRKTGCGSAMCRRRKSRSRPAWQAAGASISLRIWNGAVRKNVLPLPSSLVQPMRPPINCTKPLLIANPRPVPPYLRVVEESACVKRSKIISTLSAAIPIPVSTTLNRSQLARLAWPPLVKPPPVESGSGSTRSVTEPRSVNFSAFPTRLRRICRSRFGSPTSPKGTPGRISRVSCKPRSRARASNISMIF